MMATTQLPSIVQNHMFAPSFEPSHSRNDKLTLNDDDSEISKWLKLENDPLPNIGSSLLSNDNEETASNDSFAVPSTLLSSSELSSDSSSSNEGEFPSNGQFPSLQPVFLRNYSSGSSSNAPAPQAQMTQLPSAPPVYSSHYVPHPAYYYAPPFSYTTQSSSQNFSDSSRSSYSTQQYATAPQYAYAPAAYQFPISYQSAASFAYPPSQYSTNSAASSSSSYGAPTYISAPSYGSYVQSSPIYSAQVIPSPVPQTSQTTQTQSFPTQNLSNPQLQQLFPSYQFKADENSEDKKRKASSRPFVRRVRQTRPKVVESKGAVQCKGRNRKKNIQCRNAALMEYIGPRPIYCAEHIELDPNSLYEKCKSSYQKEVGDNKGCKEVVLKEFGYCYKHCSDLMNEYLRARDYEKVRHHHERIVELLAQLEKDASAAKKKDGDLYQRKNKLIPKFQEMKKVVASALEVLEEERKNFPEGVSEGILAGPPVMLSQLENLSVQIAEGLSSEEEEFLSSPETLSEEDLEQLREEETNVKTFLAETLYVVTSRLSPI